MIQTFIIGAQKAGTTSLKQYLAQHPQIETHFQSEFEYFRREDYQEQYIDKVVSQQFKKGKLLLAKDVGMLVSEMGMRRLYKYNQKCQIIVILRNPVERAYSSYKMEVNAGWLNVPFSEVIKITSKDNDHLFHSLFINQGLYSYHLRKIIKLFPSEKIMYIKFEDFIDDPNRICNLIFKSLNLEAHNINANVKFNVGNTPRLKILSKLLNWLRREDNYLKRVAKSILPYRIFIEISYRLSNINDRKIQHQHQKMNEDDKLYLRTIFKPFNEELQRITLWDTSRWND